jgi:hypothetical protein
MIYFCSENYIKTTGIITDNVDVTDFSPLVRFAATGFVKYEIGSYFFDDLLTKYNAQTLSADEETIVERMKLSIVWRVCANAVTTLTYQLKNKGIQKQNGDNSESVELNEVQWMYNQYISQSQFFLIELKNYLLANSDLFPNYTSQLNKDSSIKNSCGGSDDYNNGIGFLII